MMRTDLLIAEIGSTTTVVSAFNSIATDPVLAGQGVSPTTVMEGDVNIGLDRAIQDLENRLGGELRYDRFMASSSAAGGLRMTVHGLVYDMTVRAAREAALGAGANLKFVTGGRLRPLDLDKIQALRPNIILLAGGVDFGERDTALYNAKLILGLDLKIPVIYAGNVENQDEIQEIFKGSGVDLHITENVYPRIDELNVEPARRIIQEVFEKHITEATGMEKIRERVDGHILPTPGAVMEAVILIKKELGNVICADIGGATTDIHSATEDSPDVARILLDPEPQHKRTVEGDLGLYVNRREVLALTGDRLLRERLNLSREEANLIIEKVKPIPNTKEELDLVRLLAEVALTTALKRHAGEFKEYYGPSGKKVAAQGKDLTSVCCFVGTGGALTRLPESNEIITGSLSAEKGLSLLPDRNIEVFIDWEYILASIGVMSLDHPEVARELLRKYLITCQGRGRK